MFARFVLRFGLTSAVAKMPHRSAPIVPPRPCTPNGSGAWSYLSPAFSFVQARYGTKPASTPMMTALFGETKPQQGVITTKPPTAPEQKPRTVGLPGVTHWMAGRVVPATAVGSVVVANGLAETESAAPALPALKPYQPTQSMPVP